MELDETVRAFFASDVCRLAPPRGGAGPTWPRSRGGAFSAVLRAARNQLRGSALGWWVCRYSSRPERRQARL